MISGVLFVLAQVTDWRRLYATVNIRFCSCAQVGEGAVLKSVDSCHWRRWLTSPVNFPGAMRALRRELQGAVRGEPAVALEQVAVVECGAQPIARACVRSELGPTRL